MIRIKLLCFVFLFGFESNAWAQRPSIPVFEINSDTTKVWILGSRYWDVLPDMRNNFTIDSVVNSDSYIDSLALSTQGSAIHTYWFRYRIRNVLASTLHITLPADADRADFFIRTSTHFDHFTTGRTIGPWRRDGIKISNEIPVTIRPGEEITVYHKRYYTAAGLPTPIRIELRNAYPAAMDQLTRYEDRFFSGDDFMRSFFAGFLLLAGIFNLFFFIVARQKIYLYFALFLLLLTIPDNHYLHQVLFPGNRVVHAWMGGLASIAFVFLIHFIRAYFNTSEYLPRLDRWQRILSVLMVAGVLISPLVLNNTGIFQVVNISLFVVNISLVLIMARITQRRSRHLDRFFIIAIAPFLVSIMTLVITLLLAFFLDRVQLWNMDKVLTWIRNWGDLITKLTLAWGVVVSMWGLFGKYNRQSRELAQKALDHERMEKERVEERNALIELQKSQLETQVKERTAELEQTLHNLKDTQAQLIHKEKMASLGELTAGIAHEIQNPLNFVNNFADVNAELIDEMQEEINAGNADEAKSIAADIRKNLEKISFHGDRADAIVKGMLQHSRNSLGEKEFIEVNKLVDEYLKLAYHGQRAKNKNFNAELITYYDAGVTRARIIPQDIGRVLLNLFGNAFYSMEQKEQLKHNESGNSASSNEGLPHISKYFPQITVSTTRKDERIEISVSDNGMGIPENIRNRIFQPFFTTKPTGEGTGLGLSLSYDIIKAHGGEISVSSASGTGSTFCIMIPV